MKIYFVRLHSPTKAPKGIQTSKQYKNNLVKSHVDANKEKFFNIASSRYVIDNIWVAFDERIYN